MKIYIYMPFPVVENQEKFESLVEYVKQHDCHPITKLPLIYGEKYPTWNDYLAHVNELNNYKNSLQKYIAQEIKKNYKSNEYEIIDLSYPSGENEKLLSNLNNNDILFLHAHGNTELMAVGPFY